MRPRAPVLLAYAAFILVGLGAGVTGVLLPSQIRDYGVDLSLIGLTFFASSAGFVLAGAAAGPLVHRIGVRTSLLIGGAAFVAAGAYLAVRPPFVAFVLVHVLRGFGVGVLESVLNVYLTALPDPTTLLNRLHAFFGVGALLGPVLATWMLSVTSWPMVLLALAAVCVPLMVGVRLAFPSLADDPTVVADEKGGPAGPGGGLLRATLRERGVLLGGLFLTVYVGLELGLGNWAYSYLVDARHTGELIAGYTVSGYWLGLTLGRFLISPAAARIGMGDKSMMYACVTGVTVATALTWLVPVPLAASAGFVLIGFFLGPIFPTTMAVAPALTGARLVPTAIGVMNAGSVAGAAALPWLAGAIAQGVGIWTLLPFGLALALVQFAVWWRLAGRIRRPILA